MLHNPIVHADNVSKQMPWEKTSSASEHFAVKYGANFIYTHEFTCQFFLPILDKVVEA